MNSVKIETLLKLAVGTLLSIVADVKSVQPVKEVKNNLRVQNLSVSDETASFKMALWNDFVNTCKKSITYKFINVRLSKGKLYGNLYLASTLKKITPS